MISKAFRDCHHINGVKIDRASLGTSSDLVIAYDDKAESLFLKFQKGSVRKNGVVEDDLLDIVEKLIVSNDDGCGDFSSNWNKAALEGIAVARKALKERAKTYPLK